jgi:hypothetical protein
VDKRNVWRVGYVDDLFQIHRRLYASRKAVLPKHDAILYNISKFILVNFPKK